MMKAMADTERKAADWAMTRVEVAEGGGCLRLKMMYTVITGAVTTMADLVLPMGTPAIINTHLRMLTANLMGREMPSACAIVSLESALVSRAARP